MKLKRLFPAVALLVTAAVTPVTAFAADSGTPAPPTSPPVTSSQGLFVSGDVVLGGICQVAGQFEPGQMMVFRAEVLKSDGSAIDASKTTTTVHLANGAEVKMNYSADDGFWVGVYVVPPGTQLGALPYTITAEDSSGNKGTYVPLGMPPMIVGNNITITVDNQTVEKLPKSGASVPLYPIIQFFKAQGIQVTWNGQNLSLAVPGLSPSDLPNLGGSGAYSIDVNGKTIMKLTGHVEKDPVSHGNTTFISTSIFDVLTGLSGGTFDGNTFSISTKDETSGN
jgi:hypothetical protein